MNIGELSARSGVSPRSLRHYEKLGLLSPERGANGYRHYGDEAVRTATTIGAVFALGFSSDDVRTLLPCATGAQPHDDPALRERVEEMRARVDDRIRTLADTRDALSAFLDGELSGSQRR